MSLLSSAKRDFRDCSAAIFQLINPHGGTQPRLWLDVRKCTGGGPSKSPGLANSSDSGSEKPRGNHSSSGSLNNGIEGHLGPDRPPFSQQLNVTPITVHHVSESLTNPILLLLLPGLTVDTAARTHGGPAKARLRVQFGPCQDSEFQ